MIEYLVAHAHFLFLVAARIIAVIMTTPLLSTQAVPRVAKIALGGLTAVAILPTVYDAGWQVPPSSLEFVLLLIGEVMIGVITGFYISLIFAAFSSAGQFFSLQMGFSMAESYDALSQIENPLMGQFFNLAAMLIFLSIDGFRTLFLGGVFRSFQSLNAFVLVAARDDFLHLLLSGLTSLFYDAMIISLPIVGTLFLITLANGLLSKAAPQINLLSEGFPITITVSFLLIFITFPYIADTFVAVITAGFAKIEEFLATVGGVS